MSEIRQVRIFAPRVAPLDQPLWAETLIGNVIAPVVKQFQSCLDWYWFARYDCPAEMDKGDCNILQIPALFMDVKTKYYRSIRFRYAVGAAKREEMEVACKQMIDQTGCAISGFLAYDYVGDLGGDRHLEEPRTPQRQFERAQLVVENYSSIAKLILHALIGPDANGHFCLPHHINPDPSKETPFRVIHHILCNSTDVPLFVSVAHHTPGGPFNPPSHEVRYHRVWF